VAALAIDKATYLIGTKSTIKTVKAVYICTDYSHGSIVSHTKIIDITVQYSTVLTIEWSSYNNEKGVTNND